MLSPPLTPPKGFRAAGNVEWAEFRFEGPWGPNSPRGSTPARQAGLAYERRVHRHLRESYSSGILYAPGQWIEFREQGFRQSRWAQPDGLLLDLDNGLVVIVEIKLRHTERAWWWLRQLYAPLLRSIFPPAWRFAYLEVTRYYDPEVHWPEAIRLVKHPHFLVESQCGVHIWTGRT